MERLQQSDPPKEWRSLLSPTSIQQQQTITPVFASQAVFCDVEMSCHVSAREEGNRDTVDLLRRKPYWILGNCHKTELRTLGCQRRTNKFKHNVGSERDGSTEKARYGKIPLEQHRNGPWSSVFEDIITGSIVSVLTDVLKCKVCKQSCSGRNILENVDSWIWEICFNIGLITLMYDNKQQKSFNIEKLKSENKSTTWGKKTI